MSLLDLHSNGVDPADNRQLRCGPAQPQLVASFPIISQSNISVEVLASTYWFARLSGWYDFQKSKKLENLKKMEI